LERPANRLVVLLAVGAGLAVLGQSPIARPAPVEAPDGCLACHGDRVDAREFAASPHATLGCGACHADITDYPHPAQPSAPDCAVCHGETVAAHRHSVHGATVGEGRPVAGCTDCHGDIHAVVPHVDPASPLHRSQLTATCAHCHSDETLADRFRIPVVRPVEAYLESAHARAVAAGRAGAVCSDCHGSHAIVRGSDPQAPVWRTNLAETCGKCHVQVLAAYRDSVHGEALRRGAAEAPVCTTCHGEHRILSNSEPASPVFAANIPGETCGRCHGDTRLSEKYGLPVGNVTAFQDSYHGLALRAGQMTAANCASCHGVHDILPSSDPRSHVHQANLPATCGRCHPGAGTVFALGQVHVLPSTDGVPAVYWIRLAYLWLIGGAIGSMAVHNLLDFARKARRRARPPADIGPGAPERMTRELRWQHGLVMLSFTVLVYTGFALTYPESWWASPLLRWETQLGLRGLLHRISASVMLIALGWHLARLAASRRMRARFASMRWSRRDLGQLWSALSYYLGRRPTPPHQGEKFGYVEKAEYWAFMWGSTIMAISGLALWFENLSLQYLPKWVTDVATVIHFYEAVLATLSILVWHLYWVIFDPDVYPMDTSWWSGRSPAARVLERRPAPPGPREEWPDTRE
jgi:cytochrome b subunit of formate dehydrogenase